MRRTPVTTATLRQYRARSEASFARPSAPPKLAVAQASRNTIARHISYIAFPLIA
jgi:hypothetical protein